MRALIALTLCASGCDQLFQINQIEIDDARPSPDANRVDPPRLVSSGFMNYADGQLMTEVSVTMAEVQAGDLLVVAVCEIPNDPIQSVSDDLHTVYVHASADAAIATPTLAAQLFYGLAGGSGSATIIASFKGIGATNIDVRVAEYTNIDPVSPFDDASGKSALATTSVATSVVVHAVPALLVAATCVGDVSTGVDGFDTRILTSPNGDLLADSISSTVSDEIATAHQASASGAIVQLAAFYGSAAR